MTRYQQKLFIHLRIWRDKQAELEGVEPAMILTNPLLQEICKKRPGTVAALETIAVIRKWQINHYGEQLIKELSAFSTVS
jgi:superfamily II DNA helicase RecQ